jgi:heme oxygenase
MFSENKKLASADALDCMPPILKATKEVSQGMFNCSNGLSAQLRLSTMNAHRVVEQRLRWPESIANLVDYENCLARLLALYRPLEASLMRIDDWVEQGFDRPTAICSARLTADLEMLGKRSHESVDAPESILPILSHFAQALGVLYVIEGSALGSQFILKNVRSNLGEGINGADSFFSGRREATVGFWVEFRTSLDRYGVDHPEQTGAIVEGANAMFEAMGMWMRG